MPFKFSRSIPLGIGLSVLLAACGGQQPETTDAVEESTQDQQVRDTELLLVGGALFSIPSPTQSAFLLRKEGLAYQKDRTVALERGETATRTSQAALLGMLGADMAYVTVYNDGQRAMATLQAIEKLSAKLQLSNAFDRSLLERFRNNLGSEDSLLQFSGAAFRAADQYLKNDEQHEVSTLVLLGGWVESLHLVLSDTKTSSNKVLMSRVGAQRSSMDGLVTLVETHVTGDARTSLLTALRDLRSTFEGVSMDYTYEKPVTDAAARTTYINSTSSVSITAEQIAAIAASVSTLRNLILA